MSWRCVFGEAGKNFTSAHKKVYRNLISLFLEFEWSHYFRSKRIAGHDPFRVLYLKVKNCVDFNHFLNSYHSWTVNAYWQGLDNLCHLSICSFPRFHVPLPCLPRPVISPQPHSASAAVSMSSVASANVESPCGHPTYKNQFLVKTKRIWRRGETFKIL